MDLCYAILAAAYDVTVVELPQTKEQLDVSLELLKKNSTQLTQVEWTYAAQSLDGVVRQEDSLSYETQKMRLTYEERELQALHSHLSKRYEMRKKGLTAARTFLTEKKQLHLLNRSHPSNS